MPTFVHTADIHLDTPFSARFTPRQAELRRKEVMMTFQSIVKSAESADFLFVSGDLFDGRYVSIETTAFLKRCFAEIPNTHVFIAAGNHDPLTEMSVYKNNDFGGNVHVFSVDGEYFDFPELKTRVHGISFSTERCADTLISNLEVSADTCNILVVHGDVVSDRGASVYNPITREQIEKSGMDYVALGHIHKYSGIERIGGTYYAYPGIPEGRGFDEDGERYYIRGRCENGVVSAETVPVCRRRFEHLNVDVTGCGDSVEILERIKSAVRENGGDNIYRAELAGKSDFLPADTEILREQLKNEAFYIEIIDGTSPNYDISELAAEPGLKGEFVAAMLERIDKLSGREKERACLAMKIGLNAMEGGELHG